MIRKSFASFVLVGAFVLTSFGSPLPKTQALAPRAGLPIEKENVPALNVEVLSGNQKVIDEAKKEKRLFELPFSENLLSAFQKGDAGDKIEIQKILDQLADAHFFQETSSLTEEKKAIRKDLSLIKIEWSESVYYLHKYLASADVHPSLLNSLSRNFRKIYLIQEPPFQRELFDSFSKSVFVGRDLTNADISSFYIGLNLIRVLTQSESQRDDSPRQTFGRLLNFYEAVIEAGYKPMEINIQNHKKDFEDLNFRVAQLDFVSTDFMRHPEKPSGKFDESMANGFYERLTRTYTQTASGFDEKVNYEALLELEKLAHVYRFHNDAESLDKIIEILVAASGHDVHIVRNKANLLLDRIFAPKPFWVPQQKFYENYETGKKKKLKVSKKDLPPGISPTLHWFSIQKDRVLGTHNAIREEKFSAPQETETEWIFEVPLTRYGHFDLAISYSTKEGEETYLQQPAYNGRINVQKSLKGAFVYEIYVPIHGHSGQYSDEENFKGILYDAQGKPIQFSTFDDISGHLKSMKEKYSITHLYLLGALEGGSFSNDWHVTAKYSSPFSPLGLDKIRESLGGEEGLKKLIQTADTLRISVGIDVVPHLGKKTLPANWEGAVLYVNDQGLVSVLSGTDGRYEPWNDSFLKNWRNSENWKWLAEGIQEQMSLGLKSYRGDVFHALPIMIKKDGHTSQAQALSSKDRLRGNLVDLTKKDDAFQCTGYWESEASQMIPPPLMYYLTLRVQQKAEQLGLDNFLQIPETYWGRERQLTMLGMVPYEMGTFKIWEQVVNGKEGFRSEILYQFYDYVKKNYPPGAQTLKVIGNHDIERILEVFGRSWQAFLVFQALDPGIILDFEGNAEGEKWKISVDNIQRSWNEYPRDPSITPIYQKWLAKHHQENGPCYLLWANHSHGAAKLKKIDKDQWMIWGFNFLHKDSTENAHLEIQFDDPDLPIQAKAFYEISDSTTGSRTLLTGAELRHHRLGMDVPGVERIKAVALTKIQSNQENSKFLLSESFKRLLHHDRLDLSFFEDNYFVQRTRNALHSEETWRNFLNHLKKLRKEQGISEDSLFLGLKRALYYASKDMPELQKQVHTLIQTGLASEKDSFEKKLAEFLTEAYTVKDLVFVTTEANPFHTSGGMGVVMGELPKMLAEMGHRVTVITPKYKHLSSEAAQKKMKKNLEKYQVQWTGKNANFFVRGGNEYTEGIYRGNVEGVDYVLLENPELFDYMYGGITSYEKTDRFVGLARGAIEAIKVLDIRPTVLYANDAASGALPFIIAKDSFLKEDTRYRDLASRTNLIIHNPGWQYHSSFPLVQDNQNNADAFNVSDGNLSEDLRDPDKPAHINFMAAAIRTAANCIAVSPTTAKNVMSQQDGLEKLQKHVEGISNGIPENYFEDSWNHILNDAENQSLIKNHEALKKYILSNPELREKIETRFPKILSSQEDLLALDKKDPETRHLLHIWLKLNIQHTQKFKVDPDIRLITMIHRLTDQKGFDLLIQAQEALLEGEKEIQIIVGGPEENKSLHNELEKMSKRYPQKMTFQSGFLDMRYFCGGSDVFLMPSRYEPGGISNQEASALGALVVAYATGGLLDSVVPVQIKNGEHVGNGYFFADHKPEAFTQAINEALKYLDGKTDAQIIEIRQWAMKHVRTWNQVAEEYLDSMYRQMEMVPESPKNESVQSIGTQEAFKKAA